MKFFKYPSLVNYYAIGKERRIADLLDEDWYATEKIHGANTSIIVDRNGNVEYAKRSGILTFDNAGDKMFNGLPECVSEDLLDNIKNIIDNYNYCDYVIVYGEYFGASIQSMEYDLNKENKKGFRVFNVFIHTEGGSDETFTVLGFSDLSFYFTKDQLVPTYGFSGVETLRYFLNEDMTDDSLLGGYKEGITYKPLNTYKIDENHKFIGVKRKTDRFLETSNVPKHKPKKAISLEDLELRDDLGRYVTENRLDNVLSHGEFDLVPESIGSIMKEMKNDVIKEYTAENKVEDESKLPKLINAYSKDIAMMIKNKIKQQSLGVYS